MRELREKQQFELEQWHLWKKTKDPAVLNNLMNSFKPLVKKQVNIWRGNLPDVFLEAEANKLLFNALNTYDPKKGTALNTHITNQLKPISRFVYTFQNVVRIPSEERIRRIGRLQTAISELSSELGRPPTSLELAERLVWNVNDIEKLLKEMHTEKIESFGFTGNPVYFEPKVRRILEAIYVDLEPKERLVFEHLTGYGGKQVYPIEQISRITGMPVSEINKFKKSIEKKVKDFGSL